ncbi:MAG: S8 family peptidase [Clostridium sp.]
MYLTIITSDYGILSINRNLISKLEDVNYIMELSEGIFGVDEEFVITYILQPILYTLEEISAIEASKVNILQTNIELNLTGKGVLVGIIDTGIDYLNEEFMDRYGNTRISAIWDQTIPSKDYETKDIPFGKLYTREEINEAIKLKQSGGDPYTIVASKDEDGHGTHMAGILGASGKSMRGIAYESEFVVVKLLRSSFLGNIIDGDIYTYGTEAIIPAIEFMSKYKKEVNKPIVILLPLGTTFTSHRGKSLLDIYIELVTSKTGIVVVTGTGNEGINDNHSSGLVKKVEDISIVDIIISADQENMALEFWAGLPNIFELSIVSPSGEETGFISASLNSSEDHKFVFEKTTVSIYYYIPHEYSGDELVRVYFRNVKSGVWRLKARLAKGNLASYNIWLLQNGITKKHTRVTPSDSYGTIMSPADSDFTVTVAAYNQNSNSILLESGIDFADSNAYKIDFAAGGEYTTTTGLNNTLVDIRGSSLAAAIGAEACILLFQWGIVQGNYPDMYPLTLKTFLRRGTIKRSGDFYPNSHWGFGIIDFYKIFENLSNA